MHIDLLKEEKLKVEENMYYNKELCIKLKKLKLMIKICGCQQQICVLTSVSHLKNYFRIKMQRSFIVFVTLILYSNRVNIYLKFLIAYLLFTAVLARKDTFLTENITQDRKRFITQSKHMIF